MKIVAIIQARMTSTRLPGKVLKEVNGEPLLQHMLNRLKRSEKIDEIVVATTINEADNSIVELCHALGVKTYRGSESDVLSRYYECAKEAEADVIIRMTSDCPVIDPIIVDQIVEFYLANKTDYVSNSIERSYPRGMDTEVFSFKALEKAYVFGIDEVEREHVTPYIYRNTEQFEIKSYSYREDESEYRLTVDTIDDFKLIVWLISSFEDDYYTLEDILEFLKANPEMAKINFHIEQKKLGE